MRTIFFLVRKELLQIFRDRIMPVAIFVAPVIILFVLAHAMTFEVKNTDLTLIDLDRSPASQRLVQKFLASGRFRIVQESSSAVSADQTLLMRRANMILRIPQGFDRDLARAGRPSVQVILNAEDGAAAGVLFSYATAIIAQFEKEWAGKGASLPATSLQAAPAGVQVESRKLYNPSGAYRDYMAIGLLAALLTIIGVLLTALNIAREKEIGTLEQLNATPITRGQFILGKLLPFWLLGLVELTVGLLVIRFAFGVAIAGNPLVIYVGASLYLLAALMLGLLISTTAANQQQALFVTYFTLVTFFFLGGIFTPVQSMPPWAQVVAEVNPIKHFVVVLRSVWLKGSGISDLSGELIAMAAFAVVVVPLALLRYRKTSG